MEKIIEILEELKPGVDFLKEEHLIDDHILESMMMVQLVAALNDEFDIKITPRDIVPEKFQSVKAINEMVERLLEDE